ncbi:MAG TPA: hypothetical protein VN283_00275 [Thiobacillus sp.]|nr:hypothetical protein [Thiobacillus sp.]
MTTTSGTMHFDASWKQVKAYLTRAENESGIVRKQVADVLGVTSPALSGWSTDNGESKISLEQIRPFAIATHMSQEEMAQLVFTRLQEKDGQKLRLDLALLTEAICYLLPSREEQRVLDIYQETCGLIPFSLFDDPDNREKLTAAMHSIASDAVSAYLAEGE